jgi:hypothetical protein
MDEWLTRECSFCLKRGCLVYAEQTGLVILMKRLAVIAAGFSIFISQIIKASVLTFPAPSLKALPDLFAENSIMKFSVTVRFLF